MLTAVVSAAPQQGPWNDNYTQVLTNAKADHRPMLVVFQNPMDPQKSIDQLEERQRSSLLDNYHLCRVDVTTANGRRVASAFNVTSVPYTVITDRGAENIILRKRGEFTDSEWIETLADYRRGSRPVELASYSKEVASATSSSGPATSQRTVSRTVSAQRNTTSYRAAPRSISSPAPVYNPAPSSLGGSPFGTPQYSFGGPACST